MKPSVNFFFKKREGAASPKILGPRASQQSSEPTAYQQRPHTRTPQLPSVRPSVRFSRGSVSVPVFPFPPEVVGSLDARGIGASHRTAPRGLVAADLIAAADWCVAWARGVCETRAEAGCTGAGRGVGGADMQQSLLLLLPHTLLTSPSAPRVETG